MIRLTTNQMVGEGESINIRIALLQVVSTIYFYVLIIIQNNIVTESLYKITCTIHQEGEGGESVQLWERQKKRPTSRLF